MERPLAVLVRRVPRVVQFVAVFEPTRLHEPANDRPPFLACGDVAEHIEAVRRDDIRCSMYRVANPVAIIVLRLFALQLVGFCLENRKFLERWRWVRCV